MSPRLQARVIRAVEEDGEWVLDVRGVPFGVIDFYGTIWSKDTDFHEEYYPGGCPAVYYHGMDEDQNPVDSPEYIGIARLVEKRDDGAWFKVVLDRTSEYARLVWEAAKKGMAAASVGGIEHLVRIDEATGHVDEWPIGELTLFDTYNGKLPAIPNAIALPALRTMYERAGIEFPALPDDQVDLLRGGIRPSGAAAPTDINSNHSIRGARTMDIEKLREIIGALVTQFAEALLAQISQLAGGEGETEAPPPEEVAAEMRTTAIKTIVDKVIEAVRTDSGFRAATDEAKVTELINHVLESRKAEFFTAGAQAARAKYDAKIRSDKEAADAAIAAAQRAAPPISAVDRVGGVQLDVAGQGSGAFVGAQRTPRITDMQDLRTAHLTFEDQALGYLMLRSQLPPGLHVEMTSIVSEPYLRAMAAKAAELGTKERRRVEDTVFMRSVIRANEIDTTGNTGFGPEWVGLVWSTMFWEKARAESKLYETMLAKGMMEIDVPQGAGSSPVPTESTDPTAYVVGVNSDVDATGRPTVATKISPFGTGSVTVTPNELAITSSYKVRLAEDSIVAILPQLNKQLQAKARETIDQVLINGDTATGANTNINLIDGTPGTGTSIPYYINSNGILKYPLVTNTALKRDASAQFSVDDWRLTLKLLGVAFRERLDNLLWLLDSDTHLTAVAFPEVATRDVGFGGIGTLESGRLISMLGIDTLVSGFMPLANNAGKVPAAGGTLGRLALVYCPYFAFGSKREVIVETDYDMLARTDVVQATLRFDTQVRGADAAALTYNIGIS